MQANPYVPPPLSDVDLDSIPREFELANQSGVLKSGSERCLAMGLAMLAFAAAICQFVLWGMLAWVLAPIALTLVAIGVTGVRGTSAQGVSLRRQLMGHVLLIFGLTALLVVAWQTSLLGYEMAKQSARPSAAVVASGNRALTVMGSMLLVVLASVIPAFLFGLGLSFWTVWSRKRCLGWSVAVFLVSPLALLLFGIINSLPGFGVLN